MLRPLLVLIALSGLASCAPAERPGIPPQHVFLLTVDGLRPDHMSAFMYERRTTFMHGRPDALLRGRTACLDDLLSQGVVFANAFAPSGRSAPSLASLMTGRSPLETGVLADGDELRAELPTLAGMLKAEGFLTLAFVSDPGEARESLTRDFERVRAAPDDLTTLAAVADWASTFDFGSEQRVFLWLHLSALAAPFPASRVAGAPDFLASFSDPAYSGDADGSDEYLARAHAGQVALSDADVARVVAHYDAELAALHHFFLRLLDYYQYVTETSGTWRRTLFVLAGTHGMELGERHAFFGADKSLHEQALRVPLAFVHTDSLTGARFLSEIVELEDVLPTLADWFEADLPKGVRGRSLLPLLDSYVERPFESRPAFGVSPEGALTARTPRWRLIWNPGGRAPSGRYAGEYAVPELALYDRAHDWKELFDVSATHRDVVRQLTEALRGWVRGAELDPRARALDLPQ